MTLNRPPRYVNVPAAAVYDPQLAAAELQTYCRIAGLAWEDKYHQHLPPTTIPELAQVLQCSERTVWGHLIRLRKRQLLDWSSKRHVLSIRITSPEEIPLQEVAVLQNLAVPVVVDPELDPDSDQFIDPDQQQQRQPLQKVAVLQNLAVPVVVDPELDSDSDQIIDRNQQQQQQPLQKVAVLQNFAVKTGRTNAPVAALPAEMLAKLDQLGWNDTCDEVAQVYIANPTHVDAWLEYSLEQTGARSRAGLFRKGLRSDKLPPTVRTTKTKATTTDENLLDQLIAQGA